MEKESIERTKLYEISDRRSDRGVDAPRTGYSRLSDANACDVDANFELHRRDLGNLVEEEGVVSFLTLRRENSFDTVPIRTREHNERRTFPRVPLACVPLQSSAERRAVFVAAHRGQPNGHKLRDRRLRGKGCGVVASLSYERCFAGGSQRTRDFLPMVSVRPGRKHCACNRAPCFPRFLNEITPKILTRSALAAPSRFNSRRQPLRGVRPF